jgi:hypothetical protein
VLTSAVACITHLLSCPSLSNTNSTKVLELEDELAAQLRDAVGGREEIEVAGFNEDEVLALGAVCARVCALIGTRDMCGWMEESEGGKQSCVWDIVSALVERGRLGYREEERVSSLFLGFWALHWIVVDVNGADDRTGTAGSRAAYYVEDTEPARYQGPDTRRREVHRNSARTTGLSSREVVRICSWHTVEYGRSCQACCTSISPSF